MSFSGKVALITGAASGIGAACARWLDAQGVAKLVLVDLDADGLDALDLGCAAVRVTGDVADEGLWQEIEARLARLDHAIINAGIANGTPIVDQDYGEWRRMFAVNVDGAFLALRCALRVMTRGEGPAPGRSVVLTSSMAGVRPLGNTSAYGSGKAAIAHMARVAAIEHARDGIRINAVAPGRVDTPIWTKNVHFQALADELGSREAAIARISEEASPLGHVCTAEEMAGQIGFLLSDAAASVTGTVFVSDGGSSLMLGHA